ncbi:MAG: hypothetical protein AB1403_00130 [Candidatus Riflebacteria bacterium]
MSNITEAISEKELNRDKIRHFAAGMLRWLLNSTPSADWQNEFKAHCQKLTEESTLLNQQLSETENKTQALIQAVPGAAMFWLGLYTGVFWLIPGVALGLAGSYLISDSINRIFSAGQEARFFRSMIYYLLRMENADGVISQAELVNLRALIEFIPTSSEEKQLWLKAIETPESYKSLAPEGDFSEAETEKILSACWSLALCDGLAEPELQTFNAIAAELKASENLLTRVKNQVEKLVSEHSQTLWQTLKLARMINPEIVKGSEELYRITSLVSLKPIDQERFTRELNRNEVALNPLTQPGVIEMGRIVVAAYLLAQIFDGPDSAIELRTLEILRQHDENSGLENTLNPLFNSLTASLKIFY